MSPLMSFFRRREGSHQGVDRRNSQSSMDEKPESNPVLDDTLSSGDSPTSGTIQRDHSSRSLSSLDTFYSSRRYDEVESELVRQGSDANLGNDSSTYSQTQPSYPRSPWSIESDERLDSSPRQPVKRESMDASFEEVEHADIPVSPLQATPAELKVDSPKNSLGRLIRYIFVEPLLTLSGSDDTAPNTEETQQDINIALMMHDETLAGSLVAEESHQQEICNRPQSVAPHLENETGQQEIVLNAPTELTGDPTAVLDDDLSGIEENESVQSACSSRCSLSSRTIAFQRGLSARREESTRNVLDGTPHSRRRSAPNIITGGSQSLSTHSQRSARSRLRQESNRSILSCRSHLSLPASVQLLLELSSDVVNAEYLEDALVDYKKAIHAAGSEIMDINIKLSKMQADEQPAANLKRGSHYHDLRMIGIVIGLLRTKMAVLYGEDEDYDQAIDMCKGAIQVHRRHPALKVAKPNVDEQDEGLMILVIERLENGQTCLEQHKALLDKIDDHSTDTVFYDCNDDGSVLSTKGIVFQMIERTANDDASTISQYGNEALELLSVHVAEQDKHDQGIKYLRDALQIHLVALGLKHPNAGKSLLRIAKMYGSGNDRENEELVLGYFNQTAAVLKHSNLGARERGSVLNDIAVIHMRRKEFEEAIKFLLDAIDTYDEDAVEIENAGRTIAALQVWRNLGECYTQVQKFRSAEGAFLKALQIQKYGRKLQDTAERLNLAVIGVDKPLLKLITDTSIADTICRIGKTRAAVGDHPTALDFFMQALAILHRGANNDKNRPNQELMEKRDQLTHTLYCIAEACRATNDVDKALAMYEMSIKLRNSNGADRQDKRLSTHIHCLSCHVGIGDLCSNSKAYSKAAKKFKEALSYSAINLVKESHPMVVMTRQKLKDAEEALVTAPPDDTEVAMLERKADAEIENGTLDMATQTLKQLLSIRRAMLKDLLERGIDTSDQIYAIACLLETFGFVFAKNGDDENAERAFKDAARLFRMGGVVTTGTMCTL